MTVMTRKELVEAFLRRLFKENPGGIFHDEANRLAAEEGISPRSLSRVALELGVKKTPQGPMHPSVWRAPDAWLEEAS